MYDLIVVGTGPAGYSSALYAKRYGLDVLVIGEELGGLCNEAHLIENYPGIKKINGIELMKRMREQVEEIGVEIKQELVTGIDKNEVFEVKTREESFRTKSIVLALGTEKRKLKMENEEQFIGKGISYCTTCDAPLYKNKKVGVVGGRDAAAKSALLLAEHAKKVYIIYRRDELRAEEVLKKRCEENEKIEFIFNATPKKVEGKEMLEKVILDNGKKMNLDGLFIEIGSVPNKQLLKIGDKELERENSYVKVNDDQSTNIEGIFAAGDFTTGSNKFRQIVTAASEGAIAALSVYKFLKR